MNIDTASTQVEDFSSQPWDCHRAKFHFLLQDATEEWNMIHKPGARGEINAVDAFINLENNGWCRSYWQLVFCWWLTVFNKHMSYQLVSQSTTQSTFEVSARLCTVEMAPSPSDYFSWGSEKWGCSRTKDKKSGHVWCPWYQDTHTHTISGQIYIYLYLSVRIRYCIIYRDLSNYNYPHTPPL